MLQLGIIAEGKTPPDTRVPLTPTQCAHIQQNYPARIVVQSSPNRCFSDDDYTAVGIAVQDSVESQDILLGVKEVPIEQLVFGKTYFFFSHTIKKQEYNKKLLQAILQKNIRLIDYEVLTDENGRRLIAFGRFAGMVGAHNALWTYGRRTGAFSLKRMKDCRDYAEAKELYKNLSLPPVRIVLTGTGRVAGGAAMVLDDMGVQKISPKAFLETEKFSYPVYTQLGCSDYVARISDGGFDKQEFYAEPKKYTSIFWPYAQCSDIMVNGIFWDSRAPQFFTAGQMQHPDFSIRVIADVTCDIAPESSIPSTLRPSTIADPVYGYNPLNGTETEAFSGAEIIDVMAIDNLPNELPRDASQAFGRQFIDYILKELLVEESSVITRGTVAVNGGLGKDFIYLREWIEDKA